MPDLPYATIGGCLVLLGAALALIMTFRRAGRRMNAHIESTAEARAEQKLEQKLGLAASATNTNVIHVGASHGNNAAHDGATDDRTTADYGTTADLIAQLAARGIHLGHGSGVHRAELRESNHDDVSYSVDYGTDRRVLAARRETRRLRTVDGAGGSAFGDVGRDGDGGADLRVLEVGSPSVITDVCVACLDRLAVAVELTQGSCDVCGGVETVEFDLYTGRVE